MDGKDKDIETLRVALREHERNFDTLIHTLAGAAGMPFLSLKTPKVEEVVQFVSEMRTRLERESGNEDGEKAMLRKENKKLWHIVRSAAGDTTLEPASQIARTPDGTRPQTPFDTTF